MTAQQALALSVAGVLRDNGSVQGPQLARKRTASAAVLPEVYRAQVVPVPSPFAPDAGSKPAAILLVAGAAAALWFLTRGRG